MVLSFHMATSIFLFVTFDTVANKLSPEESIRVVKFKEFVSEVLGAIPTIVLGQLVGKSGGQGTEADTASVGLTREKYCQNITDMDKKIKVCTL